MEKYDVLSVVGEGSYGLVMRCRHRESGQHVAIKKFLETEDDPTVRKMAIREIRMLKKLRHENLVNLIEVFRRKKRFFLVFEYLEHTILDELENKVGGLGFAVARKYIYQILRALDFIHSHNVIHRDIKPENVLVSRSGVIKLCDFGFARPFIENETFTDYVATRWYRSPELLVGDSRYGKEVDIWAIGCLYAETMTGEPLFPGESDIDQLFQIVRIVGKPNSRHQLLIVRNTMFKGMKQEQNSSLAQLFPDWNTDSLDFLTQCLRMDGNCRPDTGKLLKHVLFTRDTFLDHFLPELRAKIGHEMHTNVLASRRGGGGVTTQQQFGSGRKDEHKHHGSNAAAHRVYNNPTVFGGGRKNADDLKNALNTKERITQIGLTLLSSSSQLLGAAHLTGTAATTKAMPPPAAAAAVASLKPAMSELKSTVAQKTSGPDKVTTLIDLNVQPPSPIQFQSLQSDTFSHSGEKSSLHCSPLSVNNLTVNGTVPQYFTNRRANNYLNQPKVANVQTKLSPVPFQFGARARQNRTSCLLLDVPLSSQPQPPPVAAAASYGLSDASPRILPPPPWLATANLKVSSHGKSTQAVGGSKRSITDWKSVSIGGSRKHSSTEVPMNADTAAAASHVTALAAAAAAIPGTLSTVTPAAQHHDTIQLPTCPGAVHSPHRGSVAIATIATTTTSTVAAPFLGGVKKRLTPMATLPPTETHPFPSSRNFSACSDRVGET